MIFPLNSALIGPASERPTQNDPTIPRNGSTPPLYICIDTLDVFQDVGTGWLLVGSIGTYAPIPGLTSDGLTPGGVSLAGGIEAENAVLTGPGGTTPTLTAKKLADQTGYLLNLTDESDVLKASIAVDGEFLTVDDVLAPTGTIKASTLAFYPSGTGAPASGPHSQGEMHMDTSGALFVCTISGTPGTWLQATLS